MNFNDYLERRLSEDYTDDMASAFYHDDDKLLQKLQSNPRAYQKYAQKLQDIKQAEQSAAQGLQKAKEAVKLHKSSLTKAQKMYTDLRFKMSQAVAEMGGGVPQMSAGSNPQMQSMDPHRMDQMSSKQGLPSDEGPIAGNAGEGGSAVPQRPYDYERYSDPNMTPNYGGSWMDMGRGGLPRRPRQRPTNTN